MFFGNQDDDRSEIHDQWIVKGQIDREIVIFRPECGSLPWI